MPSSQHRKQKGFTLLELIIVVAIIGVLAAIAIPQFMIYRARAERASVISDCRTIYRGFILYYLEWQAFPLDEDEAADPADAFSLTTLKPITDPTEVGGSSIGLNVPAFMSKIGPGGAEKYESPSDTLGEDQEFFLVFPSKSDPNQKYVVAQSDNVTCADGRPALEGGTWIDGAFAVDGTELIGQ